ncbi:MAG: hypothetical protein HXY43_00460 [Fischerella sp.]|nr:hypothetical protein [Fischerella sp.]NWF57826.1 hypothetical protein [Fischerella sp.]
MYFSPTLQKAQGLLQKHLVSTIANYVCDRPFHNQGSASSTQKFILY